MANLFTTGCEGGGRRVSTERGIPPGCRLGKAGIRDFRVAQRRRVHRAYGEERQEFCEGFQDGVIIALFPESVSRKIGTYWLSVLNKDPQNSRS